MAEEVAHAAKAAAAAAAEMAKASQEMLSSKSEGGLIEFQSANYKISHIFIKSQLLVTCFVAKIMTSVVATIWFCALQRRDTL